MTSDDYVKIIRIQVGWKRPSLLIAHHGAKSRSPQYEDFAGVCRTRQLVSRPLAARINLCGASTILTPPIIADSAAQKSEPLGNHCKYSPICLPIEGQPEIRGTGSCLRRQQRRTIEGSVESTNGLVRRLRAF